MPGLVPGIHDLLHCPQGVDARDKRGHDDVVKANDISGSG